MASYQTRVDKELLLDFILTFSRFEYALKVSGFFKKPNRGKFDSRCPPDAKPDWDSFAVSLRGVFSQVRSEQLRQACEYLFGFPPNKQVIIHDAGGWGIAWETPVRPRHETDIGFILRMVRSVRNNLFHGGKYSIEAHEDTPRTEHLLRNSILVLRECLALSPRVGQHFDEATI
ncbi:MAG: hypothetical protein WAW37_06035 [Syntrophobacteraceae bacterium]